MRREGVTVRETSKVPWDVAGPPPSFQLRTVAPAEVHGVGEKSRPYTIAT